MVVKLNGTELDVWIPQRNRGKSIMTNVQIVELTGAALDWAVAQAEKCRLIHSPSTDWAIGGPIIEREGIWIRKYNDDLWNALTMDEQYYHLGVDGPTLLIAAMRCYVSSKLGDVIDVPNELLKD